MNDRSASRSTVVPFTIAGNFNQVMAALRERRFYADDLVALVVTDYDGPGGTEKYEIVFGKDTVEHDPNAIVISFGSNFNSNVILTGNDRLAELLGDETPVLDRLAEIAALLFAKNDGRGSADFHAVGEMQYTVIRIDGAWRAINNGNGVGLIVSGRSPTGYLGILKADGQADQIVGIELAAFDGEPQHFINIESWVPVANMPVSGLRAIYGAQAVKSSTGAGHLAAFSFRNGRGKIVSHTLAIPDGGRRPIWDKTEVVNDVVPLGAIPYFGIERTQQPQDGIAVMMPGRRSGQYGVQILQGNDVPKGFRPYSLAAQQAAAQPSA